MNNNKSYYNDKSVAFVGRNFKYIGNMVKYLYLQVSLPIV